MKTIQSIESVESVESIYCPNCGNSAERHYLSSDRLVRTQCPRCDYLMITCSSTGRVIEAYAPGLFA
ncbi:MAG: replication restart DNA helicase PriA [Leptolyngbya sp. SIO4C5]|uniref:replication restart DNA helicase PriA n=1 Tax=Sphaerothrix gracilis TaxID=3151835 RepID=UPI0013C0A1FB|nr:replication restart DNA helicase PriA [Leptolyngbya sp. SIO4C5]